MNLFSIIGFILALIVLYFGLYLSTSNLMLFVDKVSAFIVIGGTLAAVSISFQLNKLFQFFKIFFHRVLKGTQIKHSLVIEDLIQISEQYRAGTAMDNLAKETDDPLLQEALQMIADEIFDFQTMVGILNDRVENLFAHYNDDTQKFKSLGKYPPAFGMMGTTIGMIVLLANLGGPDAIDMIGPAMGVCLITTLYGVILSNLILIPIAENLEESTKDSFLKNKIILEGFKLIYKKSSPILIAEKLNSYLKPGDRLDWRKVVNQ